MVRKGVVSAVTLALLIGVLALGAEALDEIDRVTWLRLYNSPQSLGGGAARLYVLGMANGLTFSGTVANCAGVSLSGDELAATVATLVRDGRDVPPAVLAALAHHRCRIRGNAKPSGGRVMKGVRGLLSSGRLVSG